MKQFLILSVLCLLATTSLARPEPPKPHYGAPPAPHKQYGPPPAAPQKEYGPPPAAPQKEYGPPPPAPQKEYGPPAEVQQPLPLYGPPAPFYGPPAAPEPIVTKNVYVHVPPQEPEYYSVPEPIQTAVPKKHYKIIFIKAPNPPAPARQVVPPAVQDEHKTLVYVLVKKPEEQQPLILPAPAPTEPSKPEVYFIKYKQTNKPAEEYGPPAAPADTYGVPSQVESF